MALIYDNIGYSHCKKCWKLFDFDASGIVEKKWLYEPPEWFLYRKAMSINPQMSNFFDIDEVLLDLLFDGKKSDIKKKKCTIHNAYVQ